MAFPRLVYGKSQEPYSDWATLLHSKAQEDDENQIIIIDSPSGDSSPTIPYHYKRKQNPVPSLINIISQTTQDISIDQLSNLQAKIVKANEGRLALKDATKSSLAEIQKSITKEMEAMATQVKLINEGYTMMENTVQTLHEGELFMDSNIKILIQKWGFQFHLPPPLCHSTQRIIAPLLKQKKTIIPISISTL